MIFAPTLNKEFKKMEQVLVHNIAHDIFQLVFHENVSDEELMLYYGAGVDREALVTDTLRKLDGDQRMLRFYQQHKSLLNAYGEKKPTDDIDRDIQRDVVEALGGDRDIPGAGQGDGERAGESDQGGHGPEDNADKEGDHRGDGAKEPGSGGELDDTDRGSGSDAERGSATAEAGGSREAVGHIIKYGTACVFCTKCGKTEVSASLFEDACTGKAEKTHEVDGRNCNGMSNCKIHA